MRLEENTTDYIGSENNVRKDEYKELENEYNDNYDDSNYDNYDDGNYDNYDGQDANYDYQNDEYADENEYSNEGYADVNYPEDNYPNYGYDGDFEMSNEDIRAEIRHKRRVRNKIIVMIVTVFLLAGIAFGGYVGVTKLIDVFGTSSQSSDLKKELREREDAIRNQQESDETIAVEAPEDGQDG